MHYLSEYYKNLCEQLQEKLNILEAELGRVQANTKREREDLEAAAMNPSYSSTPDPKSDLIRVTPRPKVIDKKIDGGPKIRPKPRPASENPRLKKENPKTVNEAMSEDEARGMPVPILRSGKGGNYADWRAANDARNAALRNARLGVGNRDKVNAAREKRRKEKGTTTTEPLKIDTKPRIPGMSDDIDIMPKPDFTTRMETGYLERKVSSKDYFKVDDYTPSEPSNPATIIPRKPATKDQPIVPEPKPEEKDKIKNFIRLMRDGAKPGEKIKKTPSKTIYRDEEELPYIE
jgi:hypothetical protein